MWDEMTPDAAYFHNEMEPKIRHLFLLLYASTIWDTVRKRGIYQAWHRGMFSGTRQYTYNEMQKENAFLCMHAKI